MDEYTRERYPHGVPWTERPGYHTAEQLRRQRELVAAMRRLNAVGVSRSMTSAKTSVLRNKLTARQGVL